MSESLAERLALDPDARSAFMASLSETEAQRLLHSWRFWGRPEQIAPSGAWWLWFVIAGRAWGKNATGAQWVHSEAERRPGAVGFLASRTLGDVEKTILAHPRSGLLATQRPWNPCEHRKGDQALVYANGTRLHFYSSERPDQARGPEHDFGYGDEFATWLRVADVAGNTLFDNLLMGLRGSAGGPPQALFTSTPRPTTKLHIDQARKLSESLRSEFGTDDAVRVTRGRMLDNRTNLPAEYVASMLAKYGGTRLGQQELEGEILEAIEGALWREDYFDDRRALPERVKRVVVAVDPAVSTEENSNQTGIIKVARGLDDHLYGVKVRSACATPAQWARLAIELAHEPPVADCIVAEVNNGGDLVESNIRSVEGGRKVRVVKVHASRGKARRAEPVASIYEQRRAHHCGDPDQWRRCEYQMTMTDVEAYQGEGSPDDMDALVWGAFELFNLASDELPDFWIA